MGPHPELEHHESPCELRRRARMAGRSLLNEILNSIGPNPLTRRGFFRNPIPIHQRFEEKRPEVVPLPQIVKAVECQFAKESIFSQPSIKWQTESLLQLRQRRVGQEISHRALEEVSQGEPLEL